MSTKIVWFPFYIGDYLKDTQHLSVIEHGMYLKLILYYYSTGKPIPHARRYAVADASSIHEALLEGSSGYAICDQLLSDFFTREGDTWRHKRIEKEIEKQVQISEKNKERARKGALAMHAKRTPQARSKPASSKPQAGLENAQSQSQSHSIGEVSPITPQARPEKKSFTLPDWVDPTAWKAFVEHRKVLRKPMSVDAMELTVRNLEKLWQAGEDPKAVLEQSIQRGWQGVFSIKEDNQHGRTNQGSFGKKSATQTISEQIAKIE